jgi:hypothetical protein
MDELKMWDDTLLIVSTDHGFLLGEHDWWAKAVQPWYQEIAHIPLFIWDPRSKKQNERRQALAQWIDFAPTLLEFFQVPIPETLQGASLRERVEGDKPNHPAGLFGIFGGHINVTDGRYVYMRAPVTVDNGPLFEYTLMPNHMRNRFSPDELRELTLAEPFSFTQGVKTLKIPARGMQSAHGFGTMLFDVVKDPQQEVLLVDEAVERRMIELLLEWMRYNDAPREQYQRLGLPFEGPVSEEHLLLARHKAQALKAREKRVPLPPYSGPGAEYLELPLKELLGLPSGRPLVEKYFPFLFSGNLKMITEASLKQITTYMAGSFTAEQIGAFCSELAASADLQEIGPEKSAQPDPAKVTSGD